MNNLREEMTKLIVTNYDDKDQIEKILPQLFDQFNKLLNNPKSNMFSSNYFQLARNLQFQTLQFKNITNDTKYDLCNLIDLMLQELTPCESKSIKLSLEKEG